MLQNRGLAFSSLTKAEEFFKNVSYFRISSYLRPLEQEKDAHIYKPGSKFDTAVALYEFDAALRILLFSGIQTIEIALRSQMIQHISEIYGPFWFSDEKLAGNQFNHIENISGLVHELDRSKEDFIKDHYERYGKQSFPPAWKTLELASFGNLTKLYSNFSDNKVKKKIAQSFLVPQHEVLESWMRSVSGLRNSCAHHNRIWNKNLTYMPQIPRKLKGIWLNDFSFPSYRLYAALSCMAYWLNSIQPNNSFVTKIKSLLAAYPEVDVAAMGFPGSWNSEPLWQIV